MIRLLFDGETESYVQLVCSRKGVTLENYILENFEWDDQLECLEPGASPDHEICESCDFNDRCPDAKLED